MHTHMQICVFAFAEYLYLYTPIHSNVEISKYACLNMGCAATQVLHVASKFTFIVVKVSLCECLL